LPLAVPSAEKIRTFDVLVSMLIFANSEYGASPVAATFIAEVIDACVMECYFFDHMAERDLLFHDIVAPHLDGYSPAASVAQKRDFVSNLQQTLNAPRHPIRDRLNRIATDSPDLLAVIKQGNQV
jgi:hypothetical protein